VHSKPTHAICNSEDVLSVCTAAMSDGRRQQTTVLSRRGNRTHEHTAS